MPPQHKVHWLHIPKSGTTLGVLLYGLMCQREPSPAVSPWGETCDYCGRDRNKDRWDQALWGLINWDDAPYCNWNFTTSTPRANLRNHVPLPLDPVVLREWSTFALFREPRHRLVSGWNHDKHAMGIGGDRRVAFENNVHTIEEYVSHRYIRGCATKMLVGGYCAASRNMTANAFEEALRRVHAMEFVGITESWNASACLFCRQFGVEPRRWMFGARARPGSVHNRRPLPGGGDRVPSDHWRELSPAVDPLDAQVYAAATKIFLARLSVYGLHEVDYRRLENGMKPEPGAP